MGARGSEVGEGIEKAVPGNEEQAATARTRLLQDADEMETEASAAREIEKECDCEHRGRDRRVGGEPRLDERKRAEGGQERTQLDENVPAA
jgi:hypothetical protein